MEAQSAEASNFVAVELGSVVALGPVVVLGGPHNGSRQIVLA